MATLLAHIRVRPGTEARFERIAEELHRATHEREANVRRYEYWRGAAPSTYYALESFDDLGAFVAHQTSDHHEDARPALDEVIEEIELEWVDPLPQASPLAPTVTAETPAEATPIEQRCYERFAGSLMQSWWSDVNGSGRGAAATTVDEIDFMDPAVQEDWFPYYRKLREEAPIWRMPATGEYFVSRYEDVMYVLRHPELFPNARTDSQFRLLQTDEALRYYEEHGWTRRGPLGTNPPIHREYRVLVDPWFNGAGAERARPLIERYSRDLIEPWIDSGEVEIVAQFARPLPVMVITTLLGFPLEDIPTLRRWSAAWAMPFARGLTAEQEMYVAEQGVAFQRYIWEHLQERRKEPRDDVLTHLADATFNDLDGGPRPLTDAEIINLIDHLYIGGNETTTFAITSALYLLVQQPDIASRLRKEPELSARFVDEVLRLESPTQGLWRGVIRDVEIGGVPIAKGSTLHLRYGAANRDPEMFEDPDRLDLDRRNASRHVAFAAGEHRCPGEGLTKLEQRLSVELFLARMGDLRFAPGRNDFEHLRGFWLRALRELHVMFTPLPA
jgi:cytochrome P450/quinol monooxygenase YgiN